MSKHWFTIAMFLIAIFGLFLRLLDYDRLPPFSETKDEFFYPWAGISWIKTGVPTAWSPFLGYSEVKDEVYWGQHFPMVSPWIEKPPLYTFLMGFWSVLFGETDFAAVRLSTIRLIPIALNTMAIVLIGFLCLELFSPQIALLASLLYATIPTIVMANRLSLTENLLIPISLGTLWAFTRLVRYPKSYTYAFLVGVGSLAALLTKQTGIALPAVLLVILTLKKDWKNVLIVILFSFLGAIAHPLLGVIFGWELYTSIMEQYRSAIALGVPETLASVFLYPVIGHKEKIFLDGSMLVGYLLLFTSPFWTGWTKEKTARLALIAYPLAYFTMLAMLEGGRTWFGWHLFPLYPFLAILVAYAMHLTWQTRDFLKFNLFFLALAVSSLRFLLLQYPVFIDSWQKYLGLFLVVSAIFWLTRSQKLLQGFLFFCLTIYISVNIFTVVNLSRIYPPLPQPPHTPDLSPRE